MTESSGMKMGENPIANDGPAWVGPQRTMFRGRVCSSCSRFTVFILLFSVCGMLTGCGTSSESTVSGKVTLDGQPLSTGTVTFHPVAGGPAAYGQIQADSSYRLKTGSAAGLLASSPLVAEAATISAAQDVSSAASVPASGSGPNMLLLTVAGLLCALFCAWRGCDKTRAHTTEADAREQPPDCI